MWVVWLLTFLPSVLIVFFVVASDRFREPISMVFGTLFLGFLLCLPAGILNEFLIFSSESYDELTFLAGFTEETLKFLAFLLFINNRVEFNEPMDALIYGTLISIGFATYENYEYVFLYNEPFSSLEVAQLRSVTALPLHAICGTIMGYNIGLFKIQKGTKYLVLSLLLPVFLHAVYNYLDNLLTTFGLIFVGILTCIYLHQTLRYNQGNKREEREFN